MSLIFSAFAEDIGLVGGDSIGTYVLTPPSNYFATSSQGEVLAPWVDSGVVKYFAEDACKVGVLNDSVLVAVCGDGHIISKTLPLVFRDTQSIRTYGEIYNHISRACGELDSLDPILNGQACQLLLVSMDGPNCTLTDIDLSVVHQKLTMTNGRYRTIQGDHRDGSFRGSGCRYLDDFSYNAIAIARQQKELKPFVQQCTSLEISRHIRSKTGGRVAGVGGVFLTAAIQEGRPGYMSDYVYMYANRRNVVEVMIKVIYRDGHYYIMDFVERLLRVTMTLETSAAYLSGTDTSKNVTKSHLEEAVAFSSPMVLFHSHDNRVHIQRSKSGQVLVGPSIDRRVRGGKMTFTILNDGGTIIGPLQLTIRS